MCLHRQYNNMIMSNSASIVNEVEVRQMILPVHIKLFTQLFSIKIQPPMSMTHYFSRPIAVIAYRRD